MPTAIGTFSFTVTATDSGSFTNSRAYTVNVGGPFTSAQSGPWNNPSTWVGGVGFPGCNDDVTINNGHTVTLDTTRCTNNLTINSGGTLDLNGQQFNYFKQWRDLYQQRDAGQHGRP